MIYNHMLYFYKKEKYPIDNKTYEFLGIWEELHNPTFNYGEFAIIKIYKRLCKYK